MVQPLRIRSLTRLELRLGLDEGGGGGAVLGLGLLALQAEVDVVESGEDGWPARTRSPTLTRRRATLPATRKPRSLSMRGRIVATKVRSAARGSKATV